MIQNSIFDCSLIQLVKIKNFNGHITPVNNNQDIPFEVKRVFYLYDVPGGEARGCHAHKELHQFIIAGSGSFEVIVDDGKLKKIYQLTQPNIGIHVPPGIWAELVNFSSGSICLVLASHSYEEEDYLREYNEFKQYKIKGNTVIKS